MDVNNVGVNDIHANASITLIDTLSTLPTLYPDAFPEAVRRVAEEVSFDQDVKVQVFEMTIRAVGALLSTYQTLSGLPDDPVEQGRALGTKHPADVKRYAPRMLDLATDLATRLLPAFDTPTGLPYARVNLRTGLLEGETLETCAGSLVLEFALLSRLTGDKRFESLAHRAFMGLWNRRSDEDLLGNGISVANGQWLAPLVSGVQAGIDSYFEYALKAAIMLDDAQYMDIFYDAYAAIQTHVRSDDGFFSAKYGTRFPVSAIKAHLVFWNVWQKFSALPEAWDPSSRGVAWGGWPGRPEFIEQATGDDFYLKVGERVLEDITRRAVTSCGLASLGNVETGKQENRMESFFLSETLKTGR
ncbi:hypothetical protein A1Q2_04273 [Trichosporon asahii var. asahii CBS 8904]|uniref:alpha-1,2-Mannosidase n=1 Tax=Trichosporon asahii var. asahii (strain CBS 8904) TaxID=1220162 RepID=K1VKZ3_TRIAC|nr:hypothetical protein A1Q2_04273 [Trichosporon asahii var. asahii CBS 8904]